MTPGRPPRTVDAVPDALPRKVRTIRKNSRLIWRRLPFLKKEKEINHSVCSSHECLTSWFSQYSKFQFSSLFFWNCEIFLELNFGKLDFSDLTALGDLTYCFLLFSDTVLFIEVLVDFMGNNVGIYTRRERSMAKVRRF